MLEVATVGGLALESSSILGVFNIGIVVRRRSSRCDTISRVHELRILIWLPK